MPSRSFAVLSREWLDRRCVLAAGLPERPGASARVQQVVSGAPGGEVVYVEVFEDGRLVSAALGQDDDVDVTLTQTYADALQIAKGELDASAAFMQGRVKVTGNMGKLMALMPVIQSEEYLATLAQVSAQTEY